MSETAALALTAFADRRNADVDGFVRLRAGAGQWSSLASGCAQGLQDFGAIWRDGTDVRALLYNRSAALRAIVSVPLDGLSYPSFARHHAPAQRPERALRDLHGIEPQGHPDQRSWLDHGVWSAPPPQRLQERSAPQAYSFLPVEGEGLHQIPVGPVHAGIIEPGHFRFTANGEAIVRLEERLGYVHKGIESLCIGAEIVKAARLAARMSGDSTVAASFAFALAVEAAFGGAPPMRAQILRGVMAELERMSHHVSDVGAICNDASVVAIQARCALLREDMLQTAQAAFGHRLMMDCIVPGGVARDLAPGGAQTIEAMLDRLSPGFEDVVRVYDSMPSLLDRTVTTGIVKHEYAMRYAAGGHVGRASGRSFDSRATFPYAPYRADDVEPVVRNEGDVNARVWVRILETRKSIALVRALLARLEDGAVLTELTPRAGEGAAMTEAFRGDLFIALRTNAQGLVETFHARDASVFQWPLLETAIEGNIVADFPLCNKSFNCSYSGHDM